MQESVKHPMIAPDGTELSKQQEIIVLYCQPGRTITNAVAITCLGIGSLTSRIAELTRKGYRFQRERAVDRFGRSFFKYTMPVGTKEGTADA